LTKERCIEALELGFSSVMFDGSAHDYETNIANTREVVKIAKSFGATVEGEIGHVGQASSNDNLLTDMYTTKEEAKKYLEDTGVDALAIAIGSAHGVYKSKPMLNIDRLKEIASTVDVPLVLHGGSGLTDNDFKQAIQEGISKVNIFTDINIAAVKAEFKKFSSMDKGIIDLIPAAVEAIKQETMKKMQLFSSDGKADGSATLSPANMEELTRLVAAEVRKYLNK
jgi:fructose-bisphosphate aldolase class II